MIWFDWPIIDDEIKFGSCVQFGGITCVCVKRTWVNYGIVDLTRDPWRIYGIAFFFLFQLCTSHMLTISSVLPYSQHTTFFLTIWLCVCVNFKIATRYICTLCSILTYLFHNTEAKLKMSTIFAHILCKFSQKIIQVLLSSARKSSESKVHTILLPLRQECL